MRLDLEKNNRGANTVDWFPVKPTLEGEGIVEPNLLIAKET